jgi:hypothetical protein
VVGGGFEFQMQLHSPESDVHTPHHEANIWQRETLPFLNITHHDYKAGI